MGVENERRTNIVANAARLLSDAKYLSDNKRFGSAFALSVLALEEIGKVVLDIWNASAPLASPKGSSAHLRKQMAIAALLLADRAVTEVGDADIEDPIPDELVERVAKAMYESDTWKFSTHVKIGALDKTKQLALYRDDWFEAAGLYSSSFEDADITGMFDRAKSAIRAVGVPKIMRAARAIYERSGAFVT